MVLIGIDNEIENTKLLLTKYFEITDWNKIYNWNIIWNAKRWLIITTIVDLFQIYIHIKILNYKLNPLIHRNINK